MQGNYGYYGGKPDYTANAVVGFSSFPNGNSGKPNYAPQDLPKQKKRSPLKLVLVGVAIGLILVAIAGLYLYTTDKLFSSSSDSSQGTTSSPTTVAANPTKSPTKFPTLAPTTKSPTKFPTLAPTTKSPTKFPTLAPTTKSPTKFPTPAPTTPPPTNAPTISQVQVFPVETRQGDDYVGVFFERQLTLVQANAFVSAARRWSAVVKGSGAKLSGNLISGTVCSSRVLPSAIARDHLRIFADVGPLPGNTIGQAGPCAFDTRRNPIFFPTFGQMVFDDEFILSMSSLELQSVVLHEMGHVLGIGTLWKSTSFSPDGQTILLQNQVLSNDGTQVLQTAGPGQFIGQQARNQYAILKGSSAEPFVPVEDGFDATANRLIFDPRTNGAGSIDGHWDEDFLSDELMEFAINLGSGKPPPMSSVTIAALGDLGYNIDLSFAEPFVPLARRDTPSVRGAAPEKYLFMHNDILPFEYPSDEV